VTDAPPIDVTAGSQGPTGLAKLRRISSSDRRILLVSAATVASRLLAKLAQLGFLVIAARMLSVADFAGYSYLLVLAVTFSMLSDTGVALAASREISAGRRRPGEAFWSGAPVVISGGLLGSVLVLGVGLVDSAPGSTGAALLLTCAFVAVNTVFSFAATTLRGVGRQVYEALLQGIGAVAFVAAGAVALALDYGVTAVLAILVVKEALCAAIAIWGLRSYVGLPRRVKAGLWRELLRIGIQLGIASTALAILTRIPTFVLGNLGTTDDLAWFSSAQRLADAVLIFGTTAGFALLPSITLLFESERERAWRLVGRLLVVAGVSGALLAALMLVLAPQIVTGLFGSDFENAASSARVVMAGAPAYLLLGLGWYALVALGHERRLLLLAALSAAVCLALSFALIPDRGDTGAAVAFVIPFALMAALMLGLLLRLRLVDR
jgi:O-antigen/teichoic acid export membrane protein